MSTTDNRDHRARQSELPLNHDACYFGRGWFVINSLGVGGRQRVRTADRLTIYVDLGGQGVVGYILGEPRYNCWELLPQAVRDVLRRRLIDIYDQPRDRQAGAAARLPVERVWVDG